MAEISNSVVHLTMRFDKKVLSIGTGFIYKYEDKYFIVTAWHNLTGLHSETLKPLSNNLAIPNNIIATFAAGVPNAGTIRQSIVMPLINEHHSLFYVHKKNWPRIDVAAIPFDPRANYTSEMHLSDGRKIEKITCPIMQVHGHGYTEILPIQKYLIPNEKVMKDWLDSVGVTEELFIPGYPKNIQDYYSQPVWKRATIASSIQQGWNRQPKFLIDSASISGMSGAPVLYHNTNGRVRIYGSTHQFNQEASILTGIYVGRLRVDRESDPQIGTVWNQSVINEIIQEACFEKLPEEITLTMKILLEKTQEILKDYSPQGLQSILDPEMPSRYHARSSLMKKINGRASPEKALEAIIIATENYRDPLAEKT